MIFESYWVANGASCELPAAILHAHRDLDGELVLDVLVVGGDDGCLLTASDDPEGEHLAAGERLQACERPGVRPCGTANQVLAFDQVEPRTEIHVIGTTFGDGPA